MCGSLGIVPGYISLGLRQRSSEWIFAFSHIILQNLGIHLANLRRELRVECTLGIVGLVQTKSGTIPGDKEALLYFPLSSNPSLLPT